MRSRWLDIGQVLFLRVYGPRRSRKKELAKKERGQYPTILTEQTWSIKDLLHDFRGNFSCGIQRVVPSGQDGSILPAHLARSGSQSQRAIWFILPARGASHIINIYYLPAGDDRMVKNFDRGLENAARGRRPRAAFSSPRSQFFTIRTNLNRQITCLFFFSSSKLALQITNKFVYVALVIQ